MKWLTQWAITSGVLILIVLALRHFLRDKLSARLSYALWAVVLARLLVPFQVTLPAPVSGSLPLASNLSPEVADVELYALRIESRPMPEENLQELRDLGRKPGDVLFYETDHLGAIAGFELESNTHCYVLSDTGVDRYFFYATLPQFLITLWVIGAVVAAWTIFRSNRYFGGRLKYYRHPLEGVDAPIPVYTAANVPSPCLFGLFRPAVYVTPGAAEDPDALRHILAHELTHRAHGDHIWSFLRCLALALHWYNPLVWLAAALSKRDGELACDEGAVARLGEGERVPYGRTLVDMVAAGSARPADLLSCSTTMTGGKKPIQRRVAQLVKKPETAKTALFAAAAVIALSVVFVFAGRGQPDNTPYMLLSQLDAADSIVFPPSFFSSSLYPDPIAAEDLLARAKECLSTFTYLSDDDPQPDPSPRAIIHQQLIRLDSGGVQTTYSLLWQNGYTYLFPGDLILQHRELSQEAEGEVQLWGISGTCISRKGDNIIKTLQNLAAGRRYDPELGELPFANLAPGEERAGEYEVTIPPSGDAQVSVTYESPDRTLEFGLRAEDGTEYSETVYGGKFKGIFLDIPPGLYQIFVRNTGDYTQFPAYGDGSESYDVTGAILKGSILFLKND